MIVTCDCVGGVVSGTLAVAVIVVFVAALALKLLGLWFLGL